MNNKCQAEATLGDSKNRATKRDLPTKLFTSAIGVILLAACSSQGSTFGGAGSAPVATSGSGNVDNSGGSGNPSAGGNSAPAGGSGNTTGGDTAAGGASVSNGGQPDVALGGAGPAGGAGPVGGGAPVGGAHTGGAPAAAGANSAGGSAGTGTAGATCPKPAGQICHEFFANDNSRGQVNYVNEFDPTKNWVAKVGDVGNQNSPRGIQLVDNAAAKAGKAVLVSIDKGFAEYDAVTGAQLTKISTLSAVTSAIRIPSDGTSTLPPGTTVLVRDTSPPELDYLDAKGANALAPVKLTFAAAGTEVRKLERNATTGHFSLTKYESTTAAYIYEVTELGAMVAKIPLPPGAKGYNAVWIDAGHFMATTGSNANVVTLDAKTGAVSATVGGKNLVKDATGAVVFTDFFSGLFVLPNGDAVASNWLGHVNAASYTNTPELLEFNAANKLVWSWGNQTLATFVTYGYFIR